jgi:hypothetical protein
MTKRKKIVLSVLAAFAALGLVVLLDNVFVVRNTAIPFETRCRLSFGRVKTQTAAFSYRSYCESMIPAGGGGMNCLDDGECPSGSCWRAFISDIDNGKPQPGSCTEGRMLFKKY